MERRREDGVPRFRRVTLRGEDGHLDLGMFGRPGRFEYCLSADHGSPVYSQSFRVLALLTPVPG